MESEEERLTTNEVITCNHILISAKGEHQGRIPCNLQVLRRVVYC